MVPLGCWPEGQGPDSQEPEGHLADGGTWEQLETLALQLQALSAAMELGAPLSTRQVRLLLGARPCR